MITHSSPKPSLRGALRLALIVLPLLLAGCVTGPTYKPTVHSAKEGAQISGSNAGMVGLRAVDGVRLSTGEILSDCKYTKFLVDPGERMLTVRSAYTTLFTDGNVLVNLKTVLQAGQAYQIRMVRKKNCMTVWVEDVATHEAVSDRQSTNAIVHSHIGYLFIGR